MASCVFLNANGAALARPRSGRNQQRLVDRSTSRFRLFGELVAVSVAFTTAPMIEQPEVSSAEYALLGRTASPFDIRNSCFFCLLASHSILFRLTKLFLTRKQFAVYANKLPSFDSNWGRCFLGILPFRNTNSGLV